ncbi:MAG: cysteine desulfurase [Clostridia bacterium]|nr:cysteine desulfurase [Clostridia bacterium]
MIYMDNAATTRVRGEVVQAMLPYFGEIYGNPSSVHGAGRAARKACENARRQLAAYFGCEAREIYFTSGGSEADSWALETAAANAGGKRTLIVSAIEHKAILNAAKGLAKRGFTVKYLPADAQGLVDPEALKREIDSDTFLVSVMAANNEVGALQPIDELGKIAHDCGALFHTDAVQAVSAFNWNLKNQPIDMLSLSGHKLHAPKGVGALFLRDSLPVSPLIYGGAQERGRRGGTENLSGIVGLGKAFELIGSERGEAEGKKRALAQRLLNGLKQNVDGIHINGPEGEGRVSGILNIRFDGVDGEALLFNLDLKGVCVSAGSACTSGSLDASHVLLAMGLSREDAHRSIRFSLSRENTEEEVDQVVDITEKIVNNLRRAKRLVSEE